MENKDKTNPVTIADLLSISLTDYLVMEGYLPELGVHGLTYFQSPFSADKDAFLIVSEKHNTWHCPTTQTDGNIIDLHMQLKDCSIAESFTQLTLELKKYNRANTQQKELSQPISKPIYVVDIKKNISDKKLCDFLREQHIPITRAAKYFDEYTFTLNGITHKGLGLTTSDYAPYIHVPHLAPFYSKTDLRYFDHGSDKVSVFTSVTDLLHAKNMVNTNMLLLTDLDSFEVSRGLIEAHQQINLYLPNTPEGKQYTAYAQWLSPNYKDFSQIYPKHQSLTAMQQEKYKISNAKKQHKGKHL